MEKFTLEEIRTYILSQDSLGDILYNLSVKNIMKAVNDSNTRFDILFDISGGYPGNNCPSFD